MTKAAQRIRPDTLLVNEKGLLTREGHNLLSELYDQVQKLAGLDGFTATQIADASGVANTAEKQRGRRVYDTTNNRIMVASGSSATASWYVADGSASVTPS